MSKRANPTVIGGFSVETAGSTLQPDGRILTINADTDELVAVTPTNGEVEVLCRRFPLYPGHWDESS